MVAKALGIKNMEYESPSEIWDELASVAPMFAGVSHERCNPTESSGRVQAKIILVHKSCTSRSSTGQMEKPSLISRNTSLQPKYQIISTH